MKIKNSEQVSTIKSKFNRNVVTKLAMLIVAAVASYIFFFLMARMLSVEDYGLLYSLIALTYLFTVPHETIRTVIARYTVELTSKKEYGKIKSFFLASVKNILIYSIIIFLIYLLLTPLLIQVFHASYSNIMIIGASLLVAFLLPIIWGILQGIQSFGHLGVNNSVEGVVKLAIAVGLILFGLGVNGALISIPVSMALAFLVGLLPLKKILKAKTEKFEGKTQIIRYSIAAFIIFLFFVALYSLDTILARYFFSAKTSGFYGALSVASKFILFVSIIITRVMFSSIAEHHAKKSKSKKKMKTKEQEAKQVLFTAGLYVLALIGFFLIASIFAPEIIIQIVAGNQYISIAPLLKYMVIAMGFLSLSSLLIFYNLSLDWNKKLTARILGTCVFLLIALLIVFHRTLIDFITVILAVNALLFFALLSTLLRKKHK